MPERELISIVLAAFDGRGFIESHPIWSRFLLLAALFGWGCFEAFVLGRKALACSTWFIALSALTVWIGYSLTLISIISAAFVFAAGLGLLVVYYRRDP